MIVCLNRLRWMSRLIIYHIAYCMVALRASKLIDHSNGHSTSHLLSPLYLPIISLLSVIIEKRPDIRISWLSPQLVRRRGLFSALLPRSYELWVRLGISISSGLILSDIPRVGFPPECCGVTVSMSRPRLQVASQYNMRFALWRPHKSMPREIGGEIGREHPMSCITYRRSPIGYVIRA